MGIATEGVRSVKRKGSDQRRDETMEEARGRQGRVGGSQSHKALCAHCNFIVLSTIFMGMFFFHDLFPLFFFAWQLHTSTYTSTVITFHTGSASAGQRKQHSHKKMWSHCASQLCYTAHRIATCRPTSQMLYRFPVLPHLPGLPT